MESGFRKKEQGETYPRETIWIRHIRISNTKDGSPMGGEVS